MKLLFSVVHDLAVKNGWALEQTQQIPPLLIYVKEGMQVNVYHTTGTVGTAIKHPTKGKTQLFRKNVTMRDLERIFKNPRAHTGKGYYHAPAVRAAEYFSPVKP